MKTPEEKQLAVDLCMKSLKPLFDRAERYGQWFHCSYQDIWLSPKQLRAEQAAGRYVWGAENWALRDPYDRIREAEQVLVRAQESLDNIIRQVKGTQ